MNNLLVLDACALIAYLRNEAGCQTVEGLFSQAVAGSHSILMHKVTLAEVVYDMLRTTKTTTAVGFIHDLRRLPLTVVDSLSDDFVATAAELKAFQKVSFADSFVLALAKMENATLVTADHHEFGPIEKSGEVKFESIR